MLQVNFPLRPIVPIPWSDSTNGRPVRKRVWLSLEVVESVGVRKKQVTRMGLFSDRFDKCRLAGGSSPRGIDRVKELAEHVRDAAQSMRVLAVANLEAICQ